MPIYKMSDEHNKLIKKDGLQKYRVRINYMDRYGKAKQIDRVAYGSEQAKQLERELMFSVKKEKPSQRMTVQELYDEYIISKQHEVRESTLGKTKQIIRLHILPTFKDIKIEKLSVPLLQGWKNDIEQDSHNYGIITKKNFYAEFRALLNYGVKMEYIPSNTLLRVGNFKAPLQTKKEMLFYTPDEFRKYISAAKDYAEKSKQEYQWNYYVFFCIAFYTGMRKGEILATQWKDIDGNILHITKSVTQKLKGEDRVTPPKNHSSVRDIEIPEPLRAVLKEHKKRCKAFDWFSDESYICGGQKPIRDTTIQTMNEKFSSNAGVKKIRVHDFRHSHASLLINEGINIQEVARRLGHSNIEMTLKTYAHLYPKESERALNVLNSIKI